MSLQTYFDQSGETDAGLAAKLQVTPELVRLWRHGRRRIPAERARDIERVTGVARHVLRPDLWEPPAGHPEASEAA